jgi:lipopolysaccharide export system protein LptC
MKTRVTSLFPLALMILLAALTFWLEWAVRAPAAGGAAAKRHDPDFIVDNFTITRYGDSGRIESSLTARKMIHYPDDETTHLDLPRVVSFKPDAPRVLITANQGKLSKDGEEANFYGDVVVLREANAAQPELRVMTERLQIDQKTDTAHTDDPVVILQEASRLTGVGMDVSKKDRTIKLRSQVRGTFERQK